MSDTQSNAMSNNNGSAQLHQRQSLPQQSTLGASSQPTDSMPQDEDENSRKQNIRITRSDPSVSRRSSNNYYHPVNHHRKSGSISCNPSNNNNFVEIKRLSSGSSPSARKTSKEHQERRTRWIRDRLQNYYYRQSGGAEGGGVTPPTPEQYIYNNPYQRLSYNNGGGGIMKRRSNRNQYPQPRHRSLTMLGHQPSQEGGQSSTVQPSSSIKPFQFNWDNYLTRTETDSVTSANNWISGKDSKSSDFHRPYSLREQNHFWEAAAAERRGNRSKLKAGLSLPTSYHHEYFDKNGDDLSVSRRNKYLGSQSADPDDPEEDEEEEVEEEEDDVENNNKEDTIEFHLTRQRNLPYPYRLKKHYTGLRGGREVGDKTGIPGEDEDRKYRSGSQSPCSISSESESQEACENALDPPRLSMPEGGGPGISTANIANNNGHTNGVGGRKFSVLFSFNDSWNEDNIVQSFKELSPDATTVFEAAWTGDLHQLQEILKDEGNVRKLKEGKFRDAEGRTPLHLSSACGHVPCVELLLSKGADVNSSDGNESRATPLSCAASCGSAEVVKVLLENGADVNAGYEQGKTALHWAVQAGSAECAKTLLQAGAKQNPPQVYSETPLHIAAAQGDPECLQLLLDYKADASLCKGSNRSTALHLAAEEGSAACVRLLLKAGASHAAKDVRGHTALHVAATCDADSVVALLKAGADPNSEDANGRTPLHCAVARGSRAAECVRLLVEGGADIDAQDNYGYTPLHLSAVNESSQCASILLHHGSDVTLKTNAGTNALSLLVRRIPDVMRYLVDRLDSAVTIHDHDPADPDCEIRLDFRAIVPNCEKREKGVLYGGHQTKTATRASMDVGGGEKNRDSLKPHKETEFLTCLVAAGNKKILAHPLSEAFLTLKWMRVRKFFWASLLFQIALVALFTIYVIEVYLIRCPYRRGHHYDADSEETKRLDKDIFINIPPPTIPPPPTPPPRPPFSLDPYKLLRNTSSLSLSPLPPVPPLGNQTTRPHNLTRRSADPDPGFRWFSVKPPKKNKTTSERTSEKREDSYRSNFPPPASPTRRNRGRVNIIIGGDGAVASPPQLSPTPPPSSSGEDEDAARMEPIQCRLTTSLQVIWILLVAFASLMAIKEVFQLLQSPLSYVVSSENWGQWLLIASVSIAAWSTPEFQLEYWQYPAAACGIFLAWGLMLLQVGRFPALGLYVQMLGKVAANFGLFILAYACLLIAFALAFCVLFPEHPPYSSVALSILKVFTMMVGEVDYEDLFYNDDRIHDPILFPVTAHLLYGAFVVIVTIVLMNLLVGLAVHDIQGLQKGAKLNRLSRQTALISRLESFIFSKKLQMILPRSLGSILQKSALLVPSSYNWSFYFRPNDPRDKRLPKEIKQASLRLAASRHSSGKSKSRTSSSHQTRQYDTPVPPTSTPRPMSTFSHHQTNSRSHHHLSRRSMHDPAIRRVEERLDVLQLQLDKILSCLNCRMDAVFEAMMHSDDHDDIGQHDFRRLSSILVEQDPSSDGDNVFLEGVGVRNSASSTPSGNTIKKPMFSAEPSILKDVSSEIG